MLPYRHLAPFRSDLTPERLQYKKVKARGPAPASPHPCRLAMIAREMPKKRDCVADCVMRGSAGVVMGVFPWRRVTATRHSSAFHRSAGRLSDRPGGARGGGVLGSGDHGAGGGPAGRGLGARGGSRAGRSRRCGRPHPRTGARGSASGDGARRTARSERPRAAAAATAAAGRRGRRAPLRPPGRGRWSRHRPRRWGCVGGGVGGTSRRAPRRRAPRRRTPRRRTPRR